jgi:hypothetical protein
MGLKLNETHQLLAYADNVHLPGDNIDTIKKNTESVTDASKEVGLEINLGKTEHMSLSCHQNVGPNWDMKQQTDCLKMCHSLSTSERQKQIKI